MNPKKSSSKSNKKAQSGSNAAVVIIIVLVLIVLYILFLPPAERENLLSGGTGTGGHGSSTGTGTMGLLAKGVLLQENIGKVYKNYGEDQEIDLPSFTISTQTTGDVIKSVSSMYLKSSAFEELAGQLVFNIEPDLSDNLILSFNIAKGEGRLSITLNGKTVFIGELKEGNSPPIYLEAEDLENSNILNFQVQGPGIAFWRYNEYTLTDIKIIGDVTDISGSTSTQTITLSSTDIENLQSSRLRYLAECKEYEVLNFQIKLNGERLFYGTPDCATYNYLPIGADQLKVGDNKFVYSVEKGRVLVDRVQLQNKQNAPDYPIYFFEMDEGYFYKQQEEPFCGKADGICPLGCEQEEDVDCCFRRSDNYWCDVETDNLNDRCISFVNDCDACPSGYEDENGEAPKRCVAQAAKDNTYYCGDDEDGVCPSGCSQYYDKDCCYETSTYWCNDVPTTGLSSVCELSVENNECNDCPYGYKDEDGDEPDCNYYADQEDDADSSSEENLKSDYKVTMKFAFSNNDLKKLEIFINGRQIGINTVKEEYSRDISNYVRSGSNSIEIRPQKDATITELKILVE